MFIAIIIPIIIAVFIASRIHAVRSCPRSRVVTVQRSATVITSRTMPASRVVVVHHVRTYR